MLVVPVSASVCIKSGKLLLAQRINPLDTKEYIWEFPGGKIEYGETPVEAVIREVKEELNLDIKVERLIHAVVNKWTHNNLVLFYLTRPIGEVEYLNWYTLDEIKELDTLSGVSETIEHLTSLDFLPF